MKEIIGIITLLVAFFSLFINDLYLATTVSVGLFVVSSLIFCFYIIFSKRDSVLVGGQQVYTYPQFRISAMVATFFIMLLTVAALANTSSRDFFASAFLGTRTPTPTLTPTNTPAPILQTRTPTPTLAPTNTPTPIFQEGLLVLDPDWLGPVDSGQADLGSGVERIGCARANSFPGSGFGSSVPISPTSIADGANTSLGNSNIQFEPNSYFRTKSFLGSHAVVAFDLKSERLAKISQIHLEVLDFKPNEIACIHAAPAFKAQLFIASIDNPQVVDTNLFRANFVDEENLVGYVWLEPKKIETIAIFISAKSEGIYEIRCCDLLLTDESGDIHEINISSTRKIYFY